MKIKVVKILEMLKIFEKVLTIMREEISVEIERFEVWYFVEKRQPG